MTAGTALSILSGATGTAVFAAIAKHMPDWPVTWQGLYEWAKGSIQEIASQRSGVQITENPTERKVNIQ